MSGSRESENSISLFPFLAVLVCTMGALSLLLMVTTRKIRENKIVAAVAELEARRAAVQDEPRLLPEPVDEPAELVPQPAPVIDLNAPVKKKVAVLAKKRDAQRRLTDDEHAALKSALSKLEGSTLQLTQTQQELDQILAAKTAHFQKHQQLATERSALSEKITDAEQQLRKHREKRQSMQATKYAFVPYDGSSGTIRRPILIECTNRGMRFLQENILLTAEDLDGFTPSFNPLLAGATSLIEYWERKATDQHEPQPYVLLVVRPSGGVAYYAARRLLSRLSQPWGYELLTETEKLDIPPEDLKASETCLAAIELTRQQKENRLRPARMANRGAGDGVVRFRRGDDGFEVVESEPTSRLQGSDEGGGGAHRASSPGGRGGKGNGGNAGNGNGFPVTGSGVGNGMSRGKSGTSGSGGSENGDGAAGGHGGGQEGSGNASDDGLPPMLTARGGSKGGARGNGSAGGTNGTKGTGAPGGNDSKVGPSAGRGGKIDPLNPDAPFRDRQPSEGNAVDQPDVEGAVAGSNRQNPGAASAQPSPDSPQAAAEAAIRRNAADAGPRPLKDPPRTREAFDIERQFGSPSSDDPRKRWGMINRRATIGFTQKIRVEVTEHEVLVGEEPPIPVGNGETAEQLAGALRQNIEMHARSWGYPPENFYWVPALQFVVYPGGNSHYERMKEAAEAWELSTSVKSARVAATPAGGQK